MVQRRQLLLASVAAAAGAALAATESKTSAKASRSALIVVDSQVGVFATLWEAERVTHAIERLVAAARAAGAPVVWVQHANHSDLKYGSDAWQLVPVFKPEPSEPIIHKRYNSSFADTDLEARLRTLNVGRIVLAGAATNWCIRATAYGAVERGFDLTLVGDAHSTESITQEDGTVIAAASMVADLNVVFEWLLAPGVETDVKASADVSF